VRAPSKATSSVSLKSLCLECSRSGGFSI